MGLPFVGLCLAATVTKLANSIDDVVWLMPFISGSRVTKVRHSALYVGMFMIFTCLCGLLTQALELLLEAVLPEDAEENGWGLEKVMSVASGALLLLLATKFLFDFIQERREGEDDAEESTNSGVVADTEKAVDCTEVKLEIPTDAEKTADIKTDADLEAPQKDSPENKNQEEEKDESNFTSRKLVSVIFVGSLDDICVQASMLISGAFLFSHMIIGVFCGCCIVLSICWGASLMKKVVQVMEKIPLWLII